MEEKEITFLLDKKIEEMNDVMKSCASLQLSFHDKIYACEARTKDLYNRIERLEIALQKFLERFG